MGDPLDDLKLIIAESEKGYSDDTLMRFLIARALSPAKANTMLISYTSWRDQNKIDEIPVYPLFPPPNSIRGFDSVPDRTYFPTRYGDGYPESWKKFYPFFSAGCYHKVDKEGYPLYIERIGELQATELLENADTAVLTDFHLHNVEFLHRVLFKECSDKQGRTISKHTIIFDLAGIGFSQLKAMSILQSLSTLDNNFYPETMHKLYIVNAPSVFAYAWRMIKGWLDVKTIEKV